MWIQFEKIEQGGAFNRARFHITGGGDVGARDAIFKECHFAANFTRLELRDQQFGGGLHLGFSFCKQIHRFVQFAGLNQNIALLEDDAPGAVDDENPVVRRHVFQTVLRRPQC